MKLLSVATCLSFLSIVPLPAEDIKNAIALILPTEGNQVVGIAKFSSTKEGIKVVADIQGLKPGDHGFHIHQYGDCSAPDGSSVGDHFNPTNKKHGCPNSPEHHVGDMGNITADQNGHAQFEGVFAQMSFEGTNSIIGRSVIVHGGKDDCSSQPSGNSGPKVGCGVIGISK